MPTLSENINKIKDLHKIYHTDCAKLMQLISSLISYTPSIAFINSPKSTSSRVWNNETFYLFDEVKGFNLFLIRLFKEYKKIRIKLNEDIEICLQDLRLALNSYDREISEYEPMSEYARDKFEQDRWNLLRPLKDLENLRNEISSDKYPLTVIDDQINGREKNVIKFQNYKLEDVIKEQDIFYENLSKIEF